jgi:acetyl esterase/lipase
MRKTSEVIRIAFSLSAPHSPRPAFQGSRSCSPVARYCSSRQQSGKVSTPLEFLLGECDRCTCNQQASSGGLLQRSGSGPTRRYSFRYSIRSVKDFPRTWIVTCEKDPLRDDGVILENMLIAHGVVVQRKHYNGFGHCFWIFPQIDKRLELLADVVNGVKFVIQGQ